MRDAYHFHGVTAAYCITKKIKFNLYCVIAATAGICYVLEYQSEKTQLLMQDFEVSATGILHCWKCFESFVYTMKLERIKSLIYLFIGYETTIDFLLFY